MGKTWLVKNGFITREEFDSLNDGFNRPVFDKAPRSVVINDTRGKGGTTIKMGGGKIKITYDPKFDPKEWVIQVQISPDSWEVFQLLKLRRMAKALKNWSGLLLKYPSLSFRAVKSDIPLNA